MRCTGTDREMMNAERDGNSLHLVGSLPCYLEMYSREGSPDIL